VPGAAALVVVSDSVAVPEPVSEASLKLALTPAGIPEAFKATAPVKPFSAPTLTVYDAPVPGETVCELGDAEIEKSAEGLLMTSWTLT